MYEYWLIDIQYIYNIKKNKFKLKNIIKLSINIKYIKEATKSLKIGINSLEIETKEKNCIIIDVKDIILFLQVFYVYTQSLIFLIAMGNKLQLQLVLGRYTKY